MPGYNVYVTAEFGYTRIDSIEMVDATTEFEVGDKFVFTGKVADPTDSRYFILAEAWTDVNNLKGVFNSETLNKLRQDEGYEIISEVEDGEQYNYSVIFMANDGYTFADDIVLKYNDMEIYPDDPDEFPGLYEKYGEGKILSFSGFVSFGEHIRESGEDPDVIYYEDVETYTDTVTTYKDKNVEYTTYEYVPVSRPGGSVRYADTIPGSTRYVTYTTYSKVPATGDRNLTWAWVAIAIAGASGVVSGIAVAKRRKRNKQ